MSAAAAVKFAIGNVVINVGQIARVVGIHDTTGDPILKELRAHGRVVGGKWVADPAKCRLLTDGELQNFYAGTFTARDLELTIVCAWCSTTIRKGGPTVTHGICPACFETTKKAEGIE
jgi:hypothetical protein